MDNDFLQKLQKVVAQKWQNAMAVFEEEELKFVFIVNLIKPLQTHCIK